MKKFIKLEYLAGKQVNQVTHTTKQYTSQMHYFERGGKYLAYPASNIPMPIPLYLKRT